MSSIVRPAAATLAKDTKITLSLTNIPVSEALRYVAELAGLKLRFEAVAAELDR